MEKTILYRHNPLFYCAILNTILVVLCNSACDSGRKPCDIGEWLSWSECSAPCGEGIQTRKKQICCDVNQDETTDQCLLRCHMGHRDFNIITTEQRSCINPCTNTGYFNLTTRKCDCYYGYYGACCADTYPKFAWITTQHILESNLKSHRSKRSLNACGTVQSDIHFLIDSSGSVGSDNFNKQRQFVAQFAELFTIGPQNVQIGVTTFSTTVHPQFSMNQYDSNATLAAAIYAIPYETGGTMTDVAINWVDQNAFTRAAGDRDYVANILIVMTDGQSNNPPKTSDAAATLHSHNITTFAIGIGSGFNRAELERIATDKQHVFTVQNFDALQTLLDELQKAACKVYKSSNRVSTTSITTIARETTRQSKTVQLTTGQTTKWKSLELKPSSTSSSRLMSTSFEIGESFNMIPPDNSQSMSQCIDLPCEHGTCLPLVNGYFCFCESGYSGKNCQIDKDDCGNAPCMYGQCVDRVSDYHCECNPLFKGKNCSEMKFWSIMTISIGALALLTMFCCFMMCCTRRRRKKTDDEPNEEMPQSKIAWVH